MMLFTLSFVFLTGTVISLLILLFPNLDTAYVEFPFFTLYFTITFINYFNASPRRDVIIKTVLIMMMAFLINDQIEDLVIRLIP